jgi:hypothetical protein
MQYFIELKVLVFFVKEKIHSLLSEIFFHPLNECFLLEALLSRYVFHFKIKLCKFICPHIFSVLINSCITYIFRPLCTRK